MKKLFSFVICIVFAFAFIFSGGKVAFAVEESVDYATYHFNTENIISLVGNGAEQAFEEIDNEFEKIDKLFSLNYDSEIKRLNTQGYLLGASDEVVYLVNKAKEIYVLTDGAFNPATYLLTDLWQLSSRFSENSNDDSKRAYDRKLYTLPDQKYIDAFRQLLNFEDIVVEGNNIYLPSDKVTVDGVDYTMQIDLGGIVKGYAAQRAKQIATSYGITKGYISLGGSSIVFLQKDGADDGKYAVGVVDPDNPSSYYAKAYVKDMAMSTSGDYQVGKYFELDGKKYCHIIDGQTGRPVDKGVRTVSILCDDPILADALTTAIMVKGLDGAKAFITSKYFEDNNIIASFVYQRDWLFGGSLEMICNTDKEFFTISNGNVKLCGYMEGGQFVYNPTTPAMTFVLVVGGMVLFVLVVIVVKKITSQVKRPNIKKQKFFRMADLFLYGGIAVAVVALFLSFVVFRPQADLKFVNIYHQNNLVYQYDVSLGEGIVLEGFDGIVSVEQKGEKTIVTIDDGKYKNVVEIDEKSARMAEANCSHTKECVNSFAPIKNGNETIICDVAHVKIVGVSDGERLIING